METTPDTLRSEPFEGQLISATGDVLATASGAIQFLRDGSWRFRGHVTAHYGKSPEAATRLWREDGLEAPVAAFQAPILMLQAVIIPGDGPWPGV